MRQDEAYAEQVQRWAEWLEEDDRTIIKCNGVGKVVERGRFGGIYLDVATNARCAKEEVMLVLARLRRAQGETLWTVMHDVERGSPLPPWIT